MLDWPFELNPHETNDPLYSAATENDAPLATCLNAIGSGVGVTVGVIVAVGVRVAVRVAVIVAVRVGVRVWDAVGDTDGVSVSTIEHLMAALAGLAINNALIEIDGPEVPILDGSSAEFVAAIRKVGIEELAAPRRYLKGVFDANSTRRGSWLKKAHIIFEEAS